MKKVLILLVMIVLSACNVDYAQYDIPINRNIDMKNHEIKNVSSLNGTPLNDYITQSTIIERHLDPTVFITDYPVTGEMIGPFRMNRDCEILSSYYYLDGTGSITFNVFMGTSVDKNQTSGQATGGKSQYYYSNITKAASNGSAITDDYFDNVIDEGIWVWCKVVSITGTVNKFSLTLNKKERL